MMEGQKPRIGVGETLPCPAGLTMARQTVARFVTRVTPLDEHEPGELFPAGFT